MLSRVPLRAPLRVHFEGSVGCRVLGILRIQVVLIYGFWYPKSTQTPTIGSTWTLGGLVFRARAVAYDEDAAKSQVYGLTWTRRNVFLGLLVVIVLCTS